MAEDRRDAEDYNPELEGFRDEADLAAHRAKVPGIFGDTDTTGIDPELTVPTKDEEQAGVSVAEVDADDDEEAGTAEARRQTDVAEGGPVPSAEEVDEGAEDSDDDDDDSDRTAAEVIADIEKAESADEVDSLAAGDERVTVQKAADKRKEDLSS